MDDAALVVEVVQGLKQTLQDYGEDGARKPSYRIAGKECSNALPQGRVNEALVFAIGARKLEGIQQRADCIPARVPPRPMGDAFIHTPFPIYPISHSCRLDKDLDGNMAMVAAGSQHFVSGCCLQCQGPGTDIHEISGQPNRGCHAIAQFAHNLITRNKNLADADGIEASCAVVGERFLFDLEALRDLDTAAAREVPGKGWRPTGEAGRPLRNTGCHEMPDRASGGGRRQAAGRTTFTVPCLGSAANQSPGRAQKPSALDFLGRFP